MHQNNHKGFFFFLKKKIKKKIYDTIWNRFVRAVSKQLPIHLPMLGRASPQWACNYSEAKGGQRYNGRSLMWRSVRFV